MTTKEYFDKNNSEFIRFGDKFVEQLTDEKLIAELAQKDLEKLAKVWKLVFELLADNSKSDPNEKLTELIGIYSDLKNTSDQ